MKEIKFFKMQGAGNDFIVFDNRDYGFLLDEIISLTPRLCHRRFGAGADGVLVLQESKKADYRMIYRNADGSDAGMCGNGARCLARFAVSKGFQSTLQFLVHDQLYKAEVSEEHVTIHFPVKPKPGAFIHLEGFEALVVYSGTEHVVLWVDQEKLDDEPWLRQCGHTVRYNQSLFPNGTNVNFIPLQSNDSNIQMKTYERGVEDLTLACGTGALATAVSHHRKTSPLASGLFEYSIQSNGGILKTSFQFDDKTGEYSNLTLTGPALFVFEGSYYL